MYIFDMHLLYTLCYIFFIEMNDLQYVFSFINYFSGVILVLYYRSGGSVGKSVGPQAEGWMFDSQPRQM